MFRIYNLQELQRLRCVLKHFDEVSTTFPLDIFRTEEAISAFPYGEKVEIIYSLTVDGRLPKLVTDSGEDMRAKAREDEAEFYCGYRYDMPSVYRKRQKD